MSLEVLKRLTTEKLSSAPKQNGAVAFGVSGVIPFWYHQTTKLEVTVYRPLVCIVLQGEKEMQFHESTITLGRGKVIVVSQHLPVAARISQASSDTPYLAVVVPLEIERLRKLNDTVLQLPQKRQNSRTLRSFDLDVSVTNTLQRILELSPGSPEASLLGNIYSDELHAQLLLGDAGDDLRVLLAENSQANRIALTIAYIRDDLSRPISIAELVDISGMSNSTLHEQFKFTTGTTPLQFQKDLRLLEARNSLASSTQPISQVAFDVGYTSPTQFAREYKRKFGTSPRQARIAGNEALV